MTGVILYIDPGAGSYLVQVIIAIILSIGYGITSIRNYIAGIFTHLIKTVKSALSKSK